VNGLRPLLFSKLVLPMLIKIKKSVYQQRRVPMKKVIILTAILVLALWVVATWAQAPSEKPGVKSPDQVQAPGRPQSQQSPPAAGCCRSACCDSNNDGICDYCGRSVASCPAKNNNQGIQSTPGTGNGPGSVNKRGLGHGCCRGMGARGRYCPRSSPS
jgi:hypothetical protein